jgi:hypothetical protein
VIDIAWGSRKKGEMSFPFYVDVSQEVSRRPWHEFVPCITTSSMIYDYGEDSIIPPKGLLALMGIPVRELSFSTTSSTDLANLVGEAMFAGSVGAILLSTFLNSKAEWWTRK